MITGSFGPLSALAAFMNSTGSSGGWMFCSSACSE
jgi:hypothetical protein